jgi:GAF domain-containing protein
VTSVGFRAEYSTALRQHVLRDDETTLRHGYELGRRAVAEGVSALDVAAIHHDALASSLEAARDGQTSETIGAAGAFFQEVLSAFEMVHRGYGEASAAAEAERHRAAMLRRLSSFLADASLSARHGDAVSEVLHLVAEHARELTGATYAIASWGDGDDQVRARSTDHESAAGVDPDLLGHVERVAPALPSRVSRAGWQDEPALRALASVSNLLTVPLAALDGRRLGLLQLVEKNDRDFTDADEAVAAHLADMAAAALERAQLYHGHRISR